MFGCGSGQLITAWDGYLQQAKSNSDFDQLSSTVCVELDKIENLLSADPVYKRVDHNIIHLGFDMNQNLAAFRYNNSKGFFEQQVVRPGIFAHPHYSSIDIFNYLGTSYPDDLAELQLRTMLRIQHLYFPKIIGGDVRFCKIEKSGVITIDTTKQI